MKKLLAALVAGLVLLTVTSVAHAEGGSDSPAEDAQLFAGGGTPVTNGAFFPGTAYNDGTEFQSPAPLTISKGQNIQFTNLDYAVLTNGHRIRSFKTKRNGQPLFASPSVNGPGRELMITSHLKAKDAPYFYFCTTHTTMYGAILVTD